MPELIEENLVHQLLEYRPATIHDAASFAKTSGKDAVEDKLAIPNRPNLGSCRSDCHYQASIRRFKSSHQKNVTSDIVPSGQYGQAKGAMNTEDYYRKIAEEIDSGQQEPATWAWALAGSGGDTDKTKALYIRRRFADLTVEAKSSANTSELNLLRGELRRQLALQRRPSLYSVLGVQADASDAAIAEATNRLIASGAPLDAETRYAAESLGDSVAREQFDRRLMEQMSYRKTATALPHAAGQPEIQSFVSSTPKVLVAVALVLGIGYLGLGYSKDKSEREIRIKEAELRKEEVRRAAEIASRIVDNQKAAIDASTVAQERSAEAQERALIDARMEEERNRLDLAYRQEQWAAQAEQRRLQMEQSRLQSRFVGRLF